MIPAIIVIGFLALGVAGLVAAWFVGRTKPDPIPDLEPDPDPTPVEWQSVHVQITTNAGTYRWQSTRDGKWTPDPANPDDRVILGTEPAGFSGYAVPIAGQVAPQTIDNMRPMAISVHPEPGLYGDGYHVEPTVEIGGQVMTESQFHAARRPLIDPAPGDVSPIADEFHVEHPSPHSRTPAPAPGLFPTTAGRLTDAHRGHVIVFRPAPDVPLQQGRLVTIEAGVEYVNLEIRAPGGMVAHWVPPDTTIWHYTDVTGYMPDIEGAAVNPHTLDLWYELEGPVQGPVRRYVTIDAALNSGFAIAALYVCTRHGRTRIKLPDGPDV